MTRFLIQYPPGATPLDPNELDDLIPDYITTQSELNELEQKNIQAAFQWTRTRKSRNVLEQSFLFELHRQMFKDVWKWAGKTRTTGKNIGVDAHQISTQLGQLLANTQHWINNMTYGWDEVAARFHHKLVEIHVFPNGNGRHARLMTDLLLTANDQPEFTWGMKDGPAPLEVEGPKRKAYIAALAAADENDFAPLLEFVCS